MKKRDYNSSTADEGLGMMDKNRGRLWANKERTGVTFQLMTREMMANDESEKGKKRKSSRRMFDNDIRGPRGLSHYDQIIHCRRIIDQRGSETAQDPAQDLECESHSVRAIIPVY